MKKIILGKLANTRNNAEEQMISDDSSNRMIELGVAPEVNEYMTSEEITKREDALFLGDKSEKAAEIVEEYVEMREENVKHFKMSDGTCKAVFYNEPVHYLDEQDHTYKEIDNTFTFVERDLSDAEDFSGYENHCGNVKVKLSKEANDNNLMRIQKGEHKIVWKFLGRGQKTSENALGDFSGRLLTEAKVINCASDKGGKHNDFASKLVNEVKYENLVSGTDLQYIVSSAKVKENIIVKEKSDSYEYAFLLKAENLELELSKNQNSIEFFVTKVNESGSFEREVIFTMPAAYMYDAKGEISNDVVCELEEIQTGRYIFKIIPDKNWMESADREFPVTIDPTIFTSDKSFIQSVTLWEHSGKYFDSTYNRIVAYTGSERIMSYIKFNVPSVSYGRILNASLNLQVFDYYQEELEIRRITSNWSPESVTWDSRPSYGTEIEGYFKFYTDNRDYAPDQNIEIDLTRIAQRGADALNKGIVLKLKDEFEPGFLGFWGEYTPANQGAVPVLSMVYTNTRAIVGNKQQKNSVNRAGTGILDLYTQNLQFVHEDVRLAGEKMPLEISHIYNSKFASNLNIRSSSGYFSSNLGLGYGWKTNLHQYVFPCNSIGNVDEYSPRAKYVYIDQFGNEHILVETKLNAEGSKEITDESGKNLIYDEVDKVLKDKTGNKLYFNKYCQLEKIEDSFGNSISISFNTNQTIASVQDGAERYAYFHYNGASATASDPLLSSISYAESQRSVEFEYTNKRLTKIKYKDGTFSTYTYGETGSSYDLTSVRDQIGYRLNYIYGNNKITIQESTNVGKIANNSTTNISEKYGNKLEIDFVGNKTFLKSKDGKCLVHIFDKSGTAICSYVDQGTALNGQKNNVVNDIQFVSSENGNLFTVAANRDAENYVINGGFEQNSYCWTANNLNNCDYVTTIATVEGSGAYRIQGELNKRKYISQNVAVPSDGDSFILYGFAKARSLPTNIRTYVNGSTDNGSIKDPTVNELTDYTKFGLNAQIVYTDNTREPVCSTSFNYSEEEWQLAAVGVCKSRDNRYKKIKYIAIQAEYTNNLNDVYFDNIRLVPGRYAKQKITNNYLLQRNNVNYDFSKITHIKYTTEGFLAIQKWETVSTYKDGKCILNEDDIGKMIRQKITDGKGCVFIGGELISSEAIVGELFWGNKLARIAFVINGVEYDIFDNFILRNTQTIEIENGSGQIAELKTDLNDNIVKATIIDENGRRFDTEFTYQGAKQKSQKDVYRGIITENTYNGYGNLISTKTRNTGDYDTTNALINDLQYNNSGNTLYSDNGSRGSGFETKTNFNNAFGRLEYMLLPDGTKINYNYFNDDSLRSMSVTTENEVVSNLYNYTKGLLTQISCKNNVYNFEYDGFGEITKTIVNGIEFVGNEYYNQSDYTSSDEATFDYSKTTFHNGIDQQGKNKDYSEKSIYNKNQALICRFGEGYDSNNNLVSEEIIRVEYDDHDRAEYVHDKAMGSDKQVTYRNVYKDDGKLDYVSISGYKTGTLKDNYDNQERLVSKSITFGQQKNYAFYYDSYGSSIVPDNRLSSINLPTGANIAYDYDNLGRIRKRSIDTGYCNRKISESFGFLKSNYNKDICKEDRTTNFVSTVQYNSDSFSASAFYSYDKRGNISQVTDNGKLYRYQYDELDRLIREDNQALGFTKTYVYDGNGNIESIREYAYTTGDDLNNVRVARYGYDGVGIHKDRLMQYTGYDGQSENISDYDSIGNPCKYRGHVLKWERGRQLAKYGEIEYRYDASGIRQEKQAGNVLHKYYTDGSRIYKEERGNEVLWYHYDNTGVTGLEHNGKKYYFQKNIQGDVVRIFDEAGSLKASYIYDAWGNHRVIDGMTGMDVTHDFTIGGVTTDVSQHIGNINPFRYRGYYFDRETGLYYLNSRYYDPAICRFINADDVAYLQPETLNGNNLYAYCGNNPVMYTDPDGTFIISLIVGLTVSFTIGFAASTISQGIQYGWQNINWGQSVVDGLFAVASTALAATGIGLAGSIGIGAAMGFGQYAIDSAFHGEALTWGGAFLAIGLGALAGFLSGAGASNGKVLADNLPKRAASGMKALITTVNRYGMNSVEYRYIMNLYGKSISVAVQNIVNKNFTNSSLVIWGSAIVTPVFQYWGGRLLQLMGI